MQKRTILLSLAVLSLAFAGCNNPNGGSHQDAMTMHDATHPATAHRAAGAWMQVNRAVAVIYPTKGNSVSGSLAFDQSAAGLHITGKITGLEPNSTHALHIHEFGDQTSADGSSAGGHYNPEQHQHGAPGAAEHHAGDLGNIKADASGTATIDLTVHDISISGMKGKDAILGRGVVIHAKADDFSQPVGNAGGRIGVGVIGVAKSL